MTIETLRMRVRTVSAVILGVMLLALTCITVLDVTGRYLFNAFALARVFRARLLAALHQTGLSIPAGLTGEVGGGLPQRGSWLAGTAIPVALSVSRRDSRAGLDRL